MTEINIASEFTDAPGARYISDGEYSGEEFRKKFLEPLFENENDNSLITINLDGTEGYATSFLEEAFGGLARIVGKRRCLERFKFITVEEPSLESDILEYIKDVKE